MPPSDYQAGYERARRWMEYMRAAKGSLADCAPDNARHRYEQLRERYVEGAIDLADFTAQVVILLREGF